MHPILVDFGGGFFIGSYGVLIALGLLAAVAIASWRGKARGFPPEAFMDLAFIAGLSGFIGGRILFILLDLPGFFKAPGAFIFSRTGFVFLGGLVAASAACSYYIWKKKLDFWMTSDILVIALAIGHGFGRIGCHLAGCCYGGVCESPLGIHVPPVPLPDGTYWPNAFTDQLSAGLLPAGATQSLAVWPVQLFESASLFILAAALFAFGARAHRKGLILGLYFVSYAVIRFCLEYLRGDSVRGVYFNGLLSTSQIISIFLFIAGVVILATGHMRDPWAPLKPVEEKKRPPVRRAAQESKAESV